MGRLEKGFGPRTVAFCRRIPLREARPLAGPSQVARRRLTPRNCRKRDSTLSRISGGGSPTTSVRSPLVYPKPYLRWLRAAQARSARSQLCRPQNGCVMRRPLYAGGRSAKSKTRRKIQRRTTPQPKSRNRFSNTLGPFSAPARTLFLLTGCGRHHFSPCATTRIPSRSIVAQVRVRICLVRPLNRHRYPSTLFL
jgi:hypothetical protein